MRAEAPKRPPHTELSILPIVGGDSDLGIGGGYVASLAGIRRGVKPYVWRLESAGALTLQTSQGSVGYFDDYLDLSVPHALLPPLHFETRVSFTDEPHLRYYGLGNASTIGAGRTPSDPYYEYGVQHSRWAAEVSLHAPSHVVFSWGLGERHIRLRYSPAGKVARDAASAEPRLRRVLRLRTHLDELAFSYGVGWDSRDDEVNPQRGQFHMLRADFAPGGFGDIPYTWGRIDLILRGYTPLVPSRLTLAARAVVDWLVGEAPFFELPRFAHTFAVGGANGVRGVPAGRYTGTFKLLANCELRSALFAFSAFSKRNVLGVTAFLDAGRVFSRLPPTPALDGTGLGLKFGTGLGLRLAAGNSFVIRADVAWSPDADPLAAYLLAGRLF